MKITLNGQETALTMPLDISSMLEAQGYGGMTVAVARNGAFVPKSTYGETMLQDGDEIEIVAPMQGG